MYRSVLLFTLAGLLLLTRSHCFDSGLSGQEKTTHFGLTECALLRITASYLKSIYGSTDLDNIADGTELCDDVETMFNRIQQETRRLGINSKLRFVIDQVCTSNVLVNLEEFTSPSSHFDNEAFIEGSLLIANRLADVQINLMRDSLSVFDARQSFGQAMHTLQDFYAHSNWVELGRRIPNPNISKGQIFDLYALEGFATCSNCTQQNCAENNILPEILNGQYLTSGYFDIYHTGSSKPKGKCSHGGPFDVTTETDAIGFGINKDNENSDHGSYHIIAAKIALVATMQELESLWSTVGNDNFGRFLGFHSSSLVIVIDTTGSMGPVIELVKELTIAIIEFTRGENAFFRPSNYIFSPFNDPEWGPLTITTDAQYLIDEIKNLTVFGGGDTPELYYHGVNEALQVCEPNSIVYTFTDAPAKDYYLQPKVLARAIELKSKVFSFYVSPISPSGKRRRRRNVGEILDGSVDDDLATATGGATIGLNPDRDSNATAAFAIRNLFPKQTLLGITGSGTINRTFAIDANISRMQIDLTSSRSVLPSTSNSLHLIGPDGVSITPVLTADGTYFQLYTIENPQAGLWQISSSQSFSRTIEITIPETSNASTLTICRTVLSQPIKRESNNSYGPLLTAPTVNQSDLVIVTSCQNLRSSIQSATVELVNKVGQIISVSHASNVTETGPIIFPVLIPNTDFRMLITIKLTDGSIVQRQSDALISPTSILISITNQPYTFKNNSMIPIAFTISNQAQETLTIHMCVLDTLQILGVNGTCRNYTVSNMSSIHDKLNIDINVWLEENHTRNVSNITSGSMTFAITSNNNDRKELKNYQKIPFYIQTREYNNSLLVISA
ncbi:unnamed protein product [Rotaria magnacalcarata]|uniref:von Willebrand factor A domain-containing protein 7 n=3 Tax=Rotaria magnacalcarata TaxID=392030 RepID=A0A816YZB6_9BILA|nr:unnamed protein product [Rotaria magnacalcarata]